MRPAAKASTSARSAARVTVDRLRFARVRESFEAVHLGRSFALGDGGRARHQRALAASRLPKRPSTASRTRCSTASGVPVASMTRQRVGIGPGDVQ